MTRSLQKRVRNSQILLRAEISAALRKRYSVSRPRLLRKIFFELAFDAVELLGLGQLVLLLGDVRPDLRVFGVQRQPLLKPRLGVRLDRLGRALRLAHAAIDALVRVNHEHIFTLVEAIDRTNFHAVGVFVLDAVVVDDEGHPEPVLASLGALIFKGQARYAAWPSA